MWDYCACLFPEITVGLQLFAYAPTVFHNEAVLCAKHAHFYCHPCFNDPTRNRCPSLNRSSPNIKAKFIAKRGPSKLSLVQSKCTRDRNVAHRGNRRALFGPLLGTILRPHELPKQHGGRILGDFPGRCDTALIPYAGCLACQTMGRVSNVTGR